MSIALSTGTSQVQNSLVLNSRLNYMSRDCTKGNIMLDPSRLYPDSFHPIERNRRPDWNHNARHSTRTHTAPKYFLIDFGLSHRFTPEEEPALCLPAPGGDKSAPEHRRSLRETNTPCDPFPTDVYYLGNMVRRVFVDVRPSPRSQ